MRRLTRYLEASATVTVWKAYACGLACYALGLAVGRVR